MKKLRPFLALLLACWLLAVPALADGEADGAPDGAASVSDAVPDDAAASETDAPAPDNEVPAASDEAPASPDDTAPAPEEEVPPPADTPPSSSDDSSSFPDDTPPPAEDTPPVAEDAPPAADPAPVDPPADTPAETPTDPSVSETPAEAPTDPPVSETPAETPTDPPVTEVPSETPIASSGGSAAVPDASTDPLPVYPVPDASVAVPGLQEVPAAVSDAPAAVAPQVFTITTIPEFALAAIEPDAGNTMSQAVRALFGTYTPRVQTVATYYNGEQIAIEEQYVPGVAGLDWEWLGGFAVFCLMLYCLFRLLGGTVKYG